MTGHHRRNRLRLNLLGLGLTLLVVAMSCLNWFAPLERRLSDQRTAWCQFDVPPPSDALIHLDIDDRALADIHRWPWPRGIWAQVVDELRLAQARVVAFDVLFTEPQQTQPARTLTSQTAIGTDPIQASQPDRGSGAADGPSAGGLSEDEHFARAIKAFGPVLLPATFSMGEASPVQSQAVTAMVARPELMISWQTYEQAASHQPTTQTSSSDLPGVSGSGASPALPPHLSVDAYLPARREAMFDALLKLGLVAYGHNQPVDSTVSWKAVQPRLFPHLDPAVTSSPLQRLLEQQGRKVDAYVALRPLPHAVLNLPASAPQAMDVTLPIPVLARAAAMTAFVDVTPDPDGVVRHVPAVVSYHDSPYLQLGLGLAQLYLHNHASTAVFKDRFMEFAALPDTHIPFDSRARLVIPWTGGVEDWQSVVGRKHHMAVGYVWEAAELGAHLDANRRTADRAVYDLYRLALDPVKARELITSPLDFEDDIARAALIDKVLAELESLGYPDALTTTPMEKLTAQERTILAAIAALRVIPKENTRLAQLLAQRRLALKNRLKDKAILVGYTASGLGDIITTPLHTRCPGVIAHGAIFNAVLTNGFWYVASWWVLVPVIILMGVAGTLLATMLPPGLSTPAIVGAVLVYAAINGLLIFDRWNIQLALAGPMLAASVSWAGCTLASFMLERRERARITRRFQNYVDPTLVNYVLENPDRARLEGEARTMSVVFTDLEGFTKLSSAIHERVVPVINRYLEQMIPPIHQHQGYVNKFLGDGIMFFFGAPRENPRHVWDALGALMAMQKLMGPFNQQLQAEGLPALRMRAGMTAGRMIVGDAGSGQRSDYTVMGDLVNFAARLESANKATGTLMLINDTAAEMVQDQYLLRPVGRLQVVGRSEAAMCFEPLCLLSEAGFPRRKLVEKTHEMIQAYTERRWEDCLNLAAEVLAMDPGSAKLVALYQLNVTRQQQSPDEHFDGRIELTSK